MRFLPLLSLILLLSCGGGATVTPAGEDLGGSQDATDDTATPLPDTAPDLAPDLAPDSVSELTEDLPPACAPGEGCFGDPCGDGGDCLSGLCVGHMGDQVCTVECLEDCPDGWDCQQLGSGPDVIFACISPYTHLCRPCVTSDDCVSQDGIEDVCLVLGSQGSFCGAPCGDGECPDGFSCVDAATAEGGASKQCVPDSGICACSETASELGLSAQCWEENDIGTCYGLRTCGPQGLGACSAAVPAEEVCNGLDDDCDGETDEVTCDDGNPCTEDSCQAGGGCVHDALTGIECVDGDVCTLADHCEDGTCVGTAINCDDGNPCTTDTCDPAGGCVYGYNALTCDDGDPCTVGDLCAQGTCGGIPIDCDCQVDLDCLVLEDGDVCNGTLFCDTGVLPHVCALVADSVVDCPPPEGMDAPCLAPTCDPVTGACGLTAANEDGQCDDDDLCTMGDHCDEGSCVSGVAFLCDDGNPCTDDSCDPVDGCVNTPNTAPCDDGNACTLDETCQGGACLPAGVLSCDDGNPCTDDLCDPLTACSSVPNTAACDDGNACTLGEACQGGSCLGGAAMPCNDGNPCTDDSCDPATGCVHDPNTAPCSDGNICTTGDLCTGGACAGAGVKNCDDGTPCTDDSCDPDEGCLHTANTAACSDGNPCTTEDHCQGGGCIGGGALECHDGNPCTDDSCSVDVGCVFSVNTAPCNDGDLCTLSDVCEDGTCLGGEDLDCDDGNPCTDDTCLPESGCEHLPNTATCDDGNLCTEVDTCAGGACVGASPPDCDDDDVCTDDTCVPDQGCVHGVNNAPCDDDDVCTIGDLCNLGTCQSGGVSLPCDDGNPCTDDACDPSSGCTFTPNGATCDDGNACTTGDSCVAGVCAPGAVKDCNDGDLCTDDLCDLVAGCLHPYNTAPCDDGDLCTTGDACLQGSCQGGAPLNCADDNVCTDDLCNPQTGCVHTNNAAACDDNNVCTLGDLCADGECQPGAGVVCDDLNDCTADSCDPQTGCVFAEFFPCCGNGIPEAGEQCDDGNAIPGDGCENNCTNTITATYHFKYLGQVNNAWGGNWSTSTVCNAGTVGNEYVGYTSTGIIQPGDGDGPFNLYGPCDTYEAGSVFYKYRCVYE